MKIEYEESLKNLKQGNVILCPTDTIWGLSCDATNADAVNKIIEIKKRNAEKSFIVLVNSLNMLGLYINTFPDFAVDILEYSSDPVTIIFSKGVKLAPGVINEDGSVAIRLVKGTNDESKFCNELIRKFNKPIVSTSANFSGEPSPQFFNAISDGIKEQVDFIVPYFHQATLPKAPSKIIKMNDDGTFKVLR